MSVRWSGASAPAARVPKQGDSIDSHKIPGYPTHVTEADQPLQTSGRCDDAQDRWGRFGLGPVGVECGI